MPKINTFLRTRRKELGLTMADVAKRVGVSEATVSRWENGIIDNMRRDRIARLAAVLQVDPTAILDSYIPVRIPDDPRTELKALIDTLSDSDYERLVSVARLLLPDVFNEDQ